MLIHFICRGNTYRSRLAEGYLNLMQLDGIKAISSGVEADHNLSGPITWWAQKIIMQKNITPFESFVWQKTTKDLLENADLNVFMNSDIHEFCVKNLEFKGEKFDVWDIPDLMEENMSDDEIIKQTEEVFGRIKQKVEDLTIRLV